MPVVYYQKARHSLRLYRHRQWVWDGLFFHGDGVAKQTTWCEVLNTGSKYECTHGISEGLKAHSNFSKEIKHLCEFEDICWSMLLTNALCGQFNLSCVARQKHCYSFDRDNYIASGSGPLSALSCITECKIQILHSVSCIARWQTCKERAQRSKYRKGTPRAWMDLQSLCTDL